MFLVILFMVITSLLGMEWFAYKVRFNEDYTEIAKDQQFLFLTIFFDQFFLKNMAILLD